MKVEVKQEAPSKVKVEVSEVKMEVKDELPSPPRGQPPTSRALKRARTEATPPSPPSPEPWMVVLAVPPMYRHPDDREWAGYNAIVRLSVAEAGIVVISGDEDDDGGVSADATGIAPL
jgi:hypothetical protein